MTRLPQPGDYCHPIGSPSNRFRILGPVPGRSRPDWRVRSETTGREGVIYTNPDGRLIGMVLEDGCE